MAIEERSKSHSDRSYATHEVVKAALDCLSAAVMEVILLTWLVLTAYVRIVTGQTDTLGLADGFLSFNTTTFSLQLVKDSQTLYSLSPAGSTFDFVPTDMMTVRDNNGNYHLGDVTFRVRKVGSTAWISGDSSTSRKKLTASPVSGSTLAAANLSPTLPSGSLLNITRRWVSNSQGIQLLFDVTNSQTVAVEIGALGAPLEFNNIFTGRTATQTNEICSLFDPYIGQDAGFVQVTPLLGTEPPLVVIPVGQSPLEGWRFLPESTVATPFYQSQTFEGLYEWDFHTLAYAENEWADTTPWNAPTSFVLEAGQTRTYGLQFLVAPSIRDIEPTLQANARPVAVGIPGYILPTDQLGKLFLNYPSPVQNMTVSPAGALTWTTNNDATTSGWVGFTVTGQIWGRARLSITYADGTLQTTHWVVTNPATQAISDLGSFLTTSQWFVNETDPFKRSPSIISYDRQVNNYVLNDDRAWIPGLSDEAGAGSWLAGAMKQYVQPSAAEVVKLEQFINQTLWGSVQNFNATVKKSVYFFQPALVPGYNYQTNLFDFDGSWNEAASFLTDRAYDYVHVTAAYWALYRVARNYPALVSTHTWQWYINQAVLTVQAMMSPSVGFNTDGLMGETVIRMLLSDLQREDLTANATLVQESNGLRTSRFGSEMAWDSTGQEGVYMWSIFFNDTTTAANALNSIIAYQPLIPHWGYNGNARRYWYGLTEITHLFSHCFQGQSLRGKLRRIERQIHHYGSGLNALPLITAFEFSPTDYYLLRVGHAGLSGPMSNIDQGGFASASFHSFPQTVIMSADSMRKLAWDAYSGDYGPNFSGLSMGTRTTIINHPDFGWQAFGGIVTSTTPAIEVEIRDAVRRRVFIATIAALITLDAGAFSTVSYTPSTQTVVVTITPTPDNAIGAASAPNARVLVSQTTSVPGIGVLQPTTTFPVDAGGIRGNLRKWCWSNYAEGVVKVFGSPRTAEKMFRS
ncbi:hypothetical protein MSAN_01208600 [Mycena sanguinolenta]|uniref:Uncharacterized protein n=1 Tax=Mycena sanguinolenta TaxID=230812 RepID=A0A8H6YHA7_9AGAR|nr:hypothetical protein MSAN_01208600 [Mycena sanguinolenta]